MRFKEITTTAKSLSVSPIISSAIKNGDDMVKFKMFVGFTIKTILVFPLASLECAKLFSMPSKLRHFVKMAVLSSRKRSEHFFSVKFPHFFGSFRNAFSSFFGMFISKAVFIAKVHSFSSNRYSFFALVRMLPIPPRRVFSSEVFVLTFKRACLSAILGCNLFWGSTKLFATDLANESHISSYGALENWVNSGKHQTYQSLMSRSILSQASVVKPWKVQRLGAEPLIGDKAPTKTRPERDDIVRTIGQLIETGHKQSCDNKLTTPQDGLTRDQWAWAQYAATVSIDGFLERVANAGDSKIEDIMEEKKYQAEQGLSTLLEQHFFQASPGAKDVRSLSTIVLASGTEGGINGTTNTWWQSTVTASGSFAARGRADLTTLVNTLSVANPVGLPEMLISDQTSFEAYESSIVPQERFTDNKMADIGIRNLKFKDIPWTWSPQATSGVIFALHSDALEFIVNSDTDFLVTPFVTPANQDAKTSKILLACSLATGNRRKLGKLTGVTA